MQALVSTTAQPASQKVIQTSQSTPQRTLGLMDVLEHLAFIQRYVLLLLLSGEMLLLLETPFLFVMSLRIRQAAHYIQYVTPK